MPLPPELSQGDVTKLAQKRLARASRLATVHKDKFAQMDDDPFVQQTKTLLDATIANASSYLSQVGKGAIVGEIKHKVQERYKRRTQYRGNIRK